MAVELDNPKVKVHIGDGFPFLENKTNSYDIIITDSSDPDRLSPYFKLDFSSL